MNKDLRHFRESVREFALTNIAPHAAQIDRDNDFPAALWRQLGEAHLLGITVERKYGGSNLGYLAHLIAMEELSRGSASIGLSYAAHSNLCMDNLYRHGSEDQRQRYLPKLCSGELVGALAISEPNAGSDILGSLSCRAERQDHLWIANGTKKWITNGPEADVLIVYMRTGNTGVGSRLLTAFIIEKGMAGFEKGQRADKLGMRGSNTCELVFKDCPIPEDHVLGTATQAIPILMHGLNTERLVLTGGPLGIMQAVLDAILPYIHTRRQFGKAIGTFELIQAKLADIYTHLEAARALAYRVAERFDQGDRSSRDAAACLLFASECAVKAALESIQILGARGFMNDSPTSRLLRDAKLYEIGGGTNEIRRVLIGRELFAQSVNRAQ
jgi:isovaleryl-CoA dehydrogenase